MGATLGPAAVPALGAAEDQGWPAMRVLVIEDDENLCEIFQEFLAEIGHEPRIVHTAEAALDVLLAEPPDVVLLDIYLPGMSGFDFLRLQTVRELRVPIVVISGRVTESQAQECLALGAFDFLGKPVALERLEEVLGCFGPSGRTPPGARPPTERRGAPRAPVALSLRVHESNGPEWDATSVDLSTGGIKVRSSAGLSPGQSATLALPLPGGAVRLEIASVVVRTDLDGSAFYFVNASDWQIERLAELVERGAASRRGSVEPHLRILHTISRAIGASLDVDEVLRVALDALTQVTGHEIASLHLLSPDGRTLHLRGDRGLRPPLRDVNRELAVGQGVIGRVAASGQTACLPEAAEAPDLLPAARAVVAREGIRAFVGVPIQSHGRILGTLSLGRRTRARFTESEVALLEASAHQIGLALEHAQLYSATRRQLEDLQHAESQLEAYEKLSSVGKLAAGVAHEIRNRLAMILGQAELMLVGAYDPEKARERLQVIVRETSRAAGMLQDLLRFSRGEAAAPRPCRLEEQIAWVLELKGPELGRSRVEVTTELARVPPVLADEGEIQQVLLNLVQNAHEAMAAHAGARRLTVRLSEADGRVRVEVLDTGPGIRADVLPRIFGAFTTTKPPGEGTGLGLWVSSAIVERLGGSLRAANRPDGGAVFTLELPSQRPESPGTA